MATKKTETKKAEETKTVKAPAEKAAAKTAKPAVKAAVKAAVKKVAEKKPAAKKAAAKPAAKAAAKPAAKKAAAKPAAKKAVEVIIQSPMGGNITPEEILAKVGKADKIYIRVDENKAYWVRGKETGSVDLWD